MNPEPTRKPPEPFTPFEELLLCHPHNHFALSQLMLMAWVAACDGTVSPEELARLRQMVSDSPLSDAVNEVVSIAQKGDSAPIQCACEILCSGLEGKNRLPLFNLIVNIAVADSYLRPSENAAIRFIADLLGLQPYEMDQCFRERTSQPFPPLPDLGSTQWWEARAGQQGHNRRTSDSSSSQHRTPRTPPVDVERLKALAMLGLDEGATLADIKSAFRRLASVHHPDRFSAHGAHATQEATESFRRIKTAYDFLTENA
jgi:uncharacterized tellurite resistance protein B-like protein